MDKINKEELHSIFCGIKNGNELEFNKLYEEYKSLLYGIAFSILKNKEDSEEIVQIVFMKIFKLEKRKLPINKEASWLYEVTKNEVINFLRSKKQEINIDEIYYITNEENEINNIIDKESYNKIIQRLNKKEQEIVSLKIISDFSFKEISKILNLPIGTVQWRYYKAIHTLKLLLGNLSMFIITITIFAIKKLNIKREQSNKKEEIKEDIIEDDWAEKRQEATTKKEETNVTEDVIITEDRIEAVEIEENVEMTVSDIGILSVSSIFLIITIIYFIIFIKYQQKAKKKRLNNKKKKGGILWIRRKKY